MPDRIAVVAYESPYAPGGGIAAVMKHLPLGLAQAGSAQVSVFTPFHRKIAKIISVEPEMAPATQVEVPLDGELIPVSILRLAGDVDWIFIKPVVESIFAGIRHPYDVGDARILLRDALFFGAAVLRALPALDAPASWTLLLQDWEAATAAFPVREPMDHDKKRFYLTLHNSYDSPASDADLRAHGFEPSLAPGSTILQRALQVVAVPVFTVSQQFARDLVEEPLQAEIMTPHLRPELETRLVGIDNGPFTELAIDEAIISAARQGDFSPLIAWKSERRRNACAALQSLKPTPEKPLWGNVSKFTFDSSPWFVMAGRDDPRQKGYDVAAQAIAGFLAGGGAASFIFFPIPGDEGLPGLFFLRNLANQYPERVLALPFVFQEGYFEVLRGATFGLMPSLYEPFGMANEFYLNGCLGVGRATGGIIQQIVPNRAAASFGDAVLNRSKRYFGKKPHSTGLLFRERDRIASEVEDWRSINQTGYSFTGEYDRVAQRSRLALFHSMTEELVICIQDAVDLSKQPDQYYQMLTDGIQHIQSNFSWERCARAYLRYLQ